MSNRASRVMMGVVVALIATIIALVVLLRLRPPETVPPQPPRRTPVRVVEVAPRDLPDLLTLPGRIEARRSATLAAAKAGTLTELHVDKGARVAAGQALARVDHRAWTAAAARVRAEVADADRELARLQALVADGAVSSNDLDRVRTRAETGHAALTEAEAWVSQCTISAPFDGVVNDRFAELGDFVHEGGRVFEVVDQARVKVAVAVPEHDVAGLAVDTPVAFALAALGGETHTGRVSFIASAAARSSNSFHVELEADNAEGRLRPGMIADVQLSRGAHLQRIVVPLEAVLPMKGEHIVFVVAGDHALRKIIRLAAIVGAEAVLESGVEAGDRVVVEGQRALTDGALVEVP